MAVTEKPTPEVVEELEERWEDAPGIPGFFNTVDHKRIGLRYIYTAFIFFFLAGALALVMRVQLAQPNAGVLSPETYNEFFTMHGTTMIFLFNTPVLAGFGNYLIPLMLGSRDMAFPRLNAFSYWIFLLSGLFLLSSFVVGHPPNGGWFAYTPLTSKPYSSGINIDFWGLGVIFVGISTTVGAVNFIVTHLQAARAGHDPEPHADLRVVDARVLLHGDLRGAGGHGGGRAARARPAVRDRVLLGPPRRERAAVPAPLLVLGPSRGVHPVHPGHRHGLDDHPGVLTPAPGGLRVGRDRARDGGVHQLRRVGAPHVRHRHPRPRVVVLLRRQPDHHLAERRPVLRVDRNHVEGRRAASPPRCSSRSASC